MQNPVKKRTPPEKLNGRSFGVWLDKTAVELLDIEAQRQNTTRSKLTKRLILTYLSSINVETPVA